eukprot:112304-Prorocentrum_minimum.AAC.1
MIVEARGTIPARCLVIKDARLAHRFIHGCWTERVGGSISSSRGPVSWGRTAGWIPCPCGLAAGGRRLGSCAWAPVLNSTQ